MTLCPSSEGRHLENNKSGIVTTTNMATCELCPTKIKAGFRLCKKCQDHEDSVDESSSDEPSLKDIMSSITGMESRLSSRMDKIEAKIADTIKDLVKKEINSFKKNMETEVNALKQQIQLLQNREDAEAGVSDKPLCIVVRNLPAADDENDEDPGPLVAKVNDLIRDGVQLDSVEVESAERKKSHREDVPGVVFAQCKSTEDKERIMKNKSNLVDSDEYGNVGIHHYKRPDQLQMESNIRTLVNTLGADKLKMKGSRVVKRNEHAGGSGWQTVGRGRGRGGNLGRGQGRGSRGAGGRGRRGGRPQ